MQPQLRWGLGGVALNAVVIVAFECFRPLSLSYDGLWNARTGIWTGLLLLDNLAVLWWYAKSTEQQKEAAGKQLQLAEKGYIERNKPVVYCDRWEHPEKEGDFHYVIRNVGAGFALNVYFLDEQIGRLPIALGALAPGTDRCFPAMLSSELCQARKGAGHVLIAEGPFSRTTQWTPTLNYRTPETDALRGQVEHANGIPAVAPPRGEYQDLGDYLLNNERALRDQLERLRREGCWRGLPQEVIDRGPSAG